MATTAVSSVWIAKGVVRSAWSTMVKTASIGDPISAPNLPDKTVQVRKSTATNGFSGATIAIEGSNNTATGPYVTLNDSRGEGFPLTFTTTDIRTIMENPQFIRPRYTAATGTPSLNIEIIQQSGKR